MRNDELSLSEEFYAHCMDVLTAEGISFLVGGAFALRAYTGIIRDTKDFDIMLRPGDVETALTCLRDAGYDSQVVFPHWLAKAHHGEAFMDIIYSSGNGLCPVDDGWFDASVEDSLLGRTVRLSPPEEIIWQKAYIMERERFDGADIAHLLLHRGATMDWPRLMARFGRDTPVLLAHLLLFEFVYPSQRDILPRDMMQHLFSVSRRPEELDTPVCNGTLLSRAQYLPDIERWGYLDARVEGRGVLSAEQRRVWTNGIPNDSPRA